MKLTHLISAAAVVAGVAAGGAAFQLTGSPASTPVRPVSKTSVTSSQDSEPPKVIGGVHFEWAPCTPPAVLEDDECVTHETHTVVLPPSGSQSHDGSYGDGSYGDHSDDSDDQGYDDQGYDDSDDQGYDDQGDDSGHDDQGDDHGDEPGHDD
jgi:hypothetical protein